MATVYLALEVGIGFGALLSAGLYNNDAANFRMAYFVPAGLVLIAGGYLQFFYRKEVVR
jgi:hypothetical protein